MKSIKSLILGSAAGLIAVGGAQAADLPVKAKAVEYVKVCSLYGAGFFYIPGTDTCLKIGGYASYEADFGPGLRGSDLQSYNNSGGLGTRDNDQFFQRARANLNFDTRIATEYGVLRTYINQDFYFNTSNPGAVYNVALTNNNQSLIPSNIFIQFAGFTIGKATPVTLVPFSEAAGNGYYTAGIFGYSNMTAGQVGQLQAVYTADLGNGLTITAGIADPTYSHNAIWDSGFNAGLGYSASNPLGYTGALGNPFSTGAGSAGSSQAAGVYMPDFVGNAILSQAWGSLYLGAIVHEHSDLYYLNDGTGATAGAGTLQTFANGHAADAWGYGLIGGVQLKNLPTGTGDQVYLIGTYGSGMTGVSGSAAPTPTLFAMRGYDNPLTVPGAQNGGIGYGVLFDSVIAADGKQHLTKSWGVQGAFEHYWVPGVWRTSVFGGYGAFEYDSAASQSICAVAQKSVVGLSSNSNCNFNVYVSQFGTRTSWFPVKNLQIDAEVYYSHFDLPLSGTITAPATTTIMKAGSYGLVNQNVISGALRAIRAF